jgi:hypothetical protein
MDEADTAQPDSKSYVVAVAISPGAELDAEGTSTTADAGVTPGYDDAFGWRPPRRALVARGEEAVAAAIDAVARQISSTAQRLASAIEAQQLATPTTGEFGLDTVQVAFGLTLSGGLQTLFTAQASSSATVTITLSRAQGNSPDAVTDSGR